LDFYITNLTPTIDDVFGSGLVPHLGGIAPDKRDLSGTIRQFRGSC